MRIEMQISDRAAPRDSSRSVGAATAAKRFTYRVVAETGLRKNGRLYRHGELIQLEEATGDRFAELGEVWRIKEEASR